MHEMENPEIHDKKKGNTATCRGTYLASPYTFPDTAANFYQPPNPWGCGCCGWACGAPKGSALLKGSTTGAWFAQERQAGCCRCGWEASAKSLNAFPTCTACAACRSLRGPPPPVELRGEFGFLDTDKSPRSASKRGSPPRPLLNASNRLGEVEEEKEEEEDPRGVVDANAEASDTPPPLLSRLCVVGGVAC